MNVIKRANAPTPKFFKLLCAIGLTLAAAGGTLLTAPVVLPAGLVTLGGYLVVGGTILSAVSKITIPNDY
jgi:ABC-type xylose transport system permease subunit